MSMELFKVEQVFKLWQDHKVIPGEIDTFDALATGLNAIFNDWLAKQPVVYGVEWNKEITHWCSSGECMRGHMTKKARLVAIEEIGK